MAHYINDPYPWMEGVARDLSMVDLVLNETIPVGPAALLWWAMERGASLLTAGGPSGAGKSTLANACLSFLPEGAAVYAVAGREDPLAIPPHAGPTYLLISELSRHGRPFYISGAPARRVFALLRDGRRLVGTLHADSVEEALENLADEVELTPEDVARVDLIAISRVEGGSFARGRASLRDESLRRRIVEIGLLEPDSAGRVRQVNLASWSPTTGRLELAGPPGGVAALARWAKVPTPDAAAEIASRAAVLARLAAEGRRDPRDVDEEVLRFRTPRR